MERTPVDKGEWVITRNKITQNHSANNRSGIKHPKWGKIKNAREQRQSENERTATSRAKARNQAVRIAQWPKHLRYNNGGKCAETAISELTQRRFSSAIRTSARKSQTINSGIQNRHMQDLRGKTKMRNKRERRNIHTIQKHRAGNIR